MTELADGTRVLLGAIGTGAGPGTEPDDIGDVDLPPGSLLLLYTDGLIERDGIDEDETLSRVRQVVSDWRSDDPLAALCHRPLERPSTSDDTTVFAVRFA